MIEPTEPTEPIAPDATLDQHEIAPEGRDILSVIAELKAMLSIARAARDSTWEPATARLVGQIGVDFLSQKDDEVALQEMVAVAAAAHDGCLAAKKRTLSPARWLAREPPGLAILNGNEAGLKATIRTLAELRADWVVAFAAREIQGHLPPACRQELVRWGLASAPDVGAFFAALGQALDTTSWTSVERSIHALQDALKMNPFGERGPGPNIASELNSLTRILREAVVRTASSTALRAKTIAELQAFVVSAIDMATSIAPNLMASETMCELISEARFGNNIWPKRLGGHIGSISRRAANQLTWAATIATPKSMSELLREGLILQSSLPAFDKLVRSVVGTRWKELAEPLTQQRDNADNYGSEMESALVKLIPRWDDYRNLHQDDLDSTQLDEQIIALAKLNGVSRFGRRGDVLDFLPLRHHLVETVETPPSQVMLLRAGILVTRRDGSERVLLRALVQAV